MGGWLEKGKQLLEEIQGVRVAFQNERLSINKRGELRKVGLSWVNLLLFGLDLDCGCHD